VFGYGDQSGKIAKVASRKLLEEHKQQEGRYKKQHTPRAHPSSNSHYSRGRRCYFSRLDHHSRYRLDRRQKYQAELKQLVENQRFPRLEVVLHPVDRIAGINERY
jgi:hypothetical protein